MSHDVSPFDRAVSLQSGQPQQLEELMRALHDGHIAMPYKGSLDSPYLQQDKGFIYIKSLYLMQQELRGIERQTESSLPEAPLSERLLPEQKEAIVFALSSSLTLLTGGPGTGKSFTITELIKSYFQQRGQEKLVALAAPTGKASQQLRPHVKDLPVKLSTLQRLLALYRQPYIGQEEKEPLPFDLIIVDEASMIDLPLMVRLLHHKKRGAKLVLVGDKHQLPPVGFGQPFVDLMTLYPDHVKSLTRPMRTDRQEILSLAEHVREGLSPPSLALSWPPQISLYHYGNEAKEALERQKEFRLLTTLVEGPWGSKVLSEQLFSRQRGHFFAPIIICENDFALDLYNGLLGVMEVDEGRLIRAYFLCDEEIKSFAPHELPSYEWAYALSVHKAQGSEFDAVYFVMGPGSERFGKEIIYTGITRAKKSLQIASTEEQLRLCLQSTSQRCTGTF